MIYSIRYNGEIISSSAGGLNQIHYNAKLTMQKNNAGSLVFTLPKSHVSYDKPYPMFGLISVERDGSPIWIGRVASYVEDKNCNRTFTCEGALAFFNDLTFQESTSLYLVNVLHQFNERASDSGYGVFATGEGIGDIVLDCEEGKPFIDAFKKYLSENGGYFYTDVAGDKIAISYASGALYDSVQDIRFGDNMMDISVTINPDYLLTGFGKSISVKAFDKSYKDQSIPPFEMFSAVRVVSFPHHVDEKIMIEKLEVDLNNTSATIITLGTAIKSLSEIELR